MICKIKLTLVIILLVLVGCSPNSESFKVDFVPVFAGEKLECQKVYANEESQFKLSQLQFYISDIKLQDKAGQWHSSEISSTSKLKSVALVGGVCPNDNLTRTVELSSQISEPKGIRFNLGIPFNLNHVNPLIQPEPLNRSDMFWTWQLGYKFMRLELDTNQGGWVFHLGSIGCASPSPVRAPKSNCRYPNLSHIVISDYERGKPIFFDIQRLLQNVNLSENNNCQSAKDNELCKILLPRLGIGAAQKVFWL